MGLSKTEFFSVQQNDIALFAKAFSHPARVAILQYLFKSNQCICGDLVLKIGLAQATISQHLKALKSMGLIQGSIEGTAVCYCVDPKELDENEACTRGFFRPRSQSKSMLFLNKILIHAF